MLAWVVIFLLTAAVAAVFGFGAVASASVGIAKIIFFLAAAGFVGSLALYLLRRAKG